MFRIPLLFMCFIKITRQESISFVNTASFQNLSRSKQSENYCVLPDHPANGEIKIFGQEQNSYLPNSSVVPNTIIDLSCRGGTVTETGGLSRAICYEGKWNPSILQMGRCVRRCPQVKIEAENLSVTCTHKSPKINCTNPIDGTLVQVVCEPFYEYVGLRPTITCRDGFWDSEISHCQPVCGRKRVPVKLLTVGGSTSKVSEYPWVASIYKTNVIFSGGATIISRHFVLTAAHLLVTVSGNLLDKTNFIVAAGKYYRNYYDERDKNMQSSRVKRIYISESYEGKSLRGDLAVLTLEEPFTFTEYVQPVCIDWTNLLESYDLEEDNKGVFAGWGLTQSGGNSADELQILEVPYKSNDTCSLPLEFKRTHYTYDKFCAGYADNGTGVCDGDSGGGLFYQHDNKFYIRGVLSSTVGKRSGCDPNHPALYIKISTYLREIEKEIKRIV